MTARLNDRDWETLSAYLDSALTPEECARVEDRLNRDSDFRSACISMQRTRGIVRSVPRVKRRRSFYLTPEMVKPRGWGWLMPAMNFSSAAAAILAFFFFIMELFPLKSVVVPMQAAREMAAPQVSAPQPKAQPTAVGLALQPMAPALEEADAAVLEGNVTPEQAEGLTSEKVTAAPVINEPMGTGINPETDEYANEDQPSSAAPELPAAKEEAASTTGGLPGTAEGEILPLAQTPGVMEESSPLVEESPEAARLLDENAIPAVVPAATLSQPAIQPAAPEPKMAAATATRPETYGTGKGTAEETPTQVESIHKTVLSQTPPAGIPSLLPEPAARKGHGTDYSLIGGFFLLVSIILGACGWVMKRKNR